MFREMRKLKQQLSEEDTVTVLQRGKSGVLAVSGDDGYPYAVPLSYTYEDGKIYFHSAKQGHKIDAIKRNDKVSFCVIDKDEIIPEELTTRYRSVIAFGRAHILTDNKEIYYAMAAVSQKYSPGLVAARDAVLKASVGHYCVVEIAIEHMTGKVAEEMQQDVKGVTN